MRMRDASRQPAQRGVSSWAGALFVLACLAGGPAAADPPTLELPIDCVPGKDCWLVNLVDHDGGKAMKDFRCADHGYDGHKGTDIAVRDMGVMNEGVPVIAAAAGTVVAFRDGMPDKVPDRNFRRTQQKLFCGNGVLIRHADGWETQYCHLRRNSIVVKRGQTVKAGQRLGFVGHSGMAAFPHIHLSVRRGGRIIDPFVGTTRDRACGPGPAPLWSAGAQKLLSGPLTAIYNAGFAPRPPKVQAIRKGLHHDPVLSRRAPALLLWAEIFWVKAGDKVSLTITGPDGEVVTRHSNVLPKRQARRMIFAGRKKRALFWPAGIYRGEIVLERSAKDGQTLRFTRRAEVRLKEQ